MSKKKVIVKRPSPKKTKPKKKTKVSLAFSHGMATGDVGDTGDHGDLGSNSFEAERRRLLQRNGRREAGLA